MRNLSGLAPDTQFRKIDDLLIVITLINTAVVEDVL